MTALIIIGAILGFVILILLIRVGLHLQYNNGFSFAVTLLGIPIYDSKSPKKTEKPKRAEKSDKPAKTEPRPDNFIKKTFKEKGAFAVVGVVLRIVKALLNTILWLIKRLKIRNFNLCFSVRGEDAADTAIKYGAVCSGVYPMIAFADSNLNFKAKKIDIYSDFDADNQNFNFSVDIKAEIIILLTVAVKAYCEYKKIKEVLENE